MPRKPKIAFVTIGQSPRVDMTPEIIERVGAPIEAVEVGALDDASREEIAAMAPPPDENSLCTRLRDGTEVVIGKRKTGERLQRLLDRLDGEGFDAITLLCTGYFEHIGSKTLLIEAQRVVDATVDAMSLGCRNLGLMVPLERQVKEMHVQSTPEGRGFPPPDLPRRRWEGRSHDGTKEGSNEEDLSAGNRGGGVRRGAFAGGGV